MKIGNIKGTPEEIKNVVENHGLDIEKYFPSTRKDPNINPFVLLTISFLFLIFCIFQGMTGFLPIVIFVLLSLFFVTLVSILTHLKYNNAWVAGAIFAGGMTMSALSIDILSPTEFYNYLREIRSPVNSGQ